MAMRTAREIMGEAKNAETVEQLTPLRFDEDLQVLLSVWPMIGDAGIDPGARPMKAAWVRDLRDQCDERGIPFFWETTVFDDAEMVEDRRRAKAEGRAYATQPIEAEQSASFRS